MSPTSGPADQPASGSRRAILDEQLLSSIKDDRERLSQGNMSHVHHGPYNGQYITWRHLASLVAEQLHEMSVDGWDAKRVLRIFDRERAVPSPERALRDRQAFIEATQRVMNVCFDIAEDARLRELEAGQKPRQLGSVTNYSQFLGAAATALSFHEFDFDPASIGFVQIMDWNASRVLIEKINVGETIEVPQREEQNWIASELLEPYLLQERAKDAGSPCPTLVGFVRDTREDRGNQLILKVSYSEYYKYTALRNYLRDHRDTFDKVMSRINEADSEGGLDDLISRSPDSNIVINVTVQSRDGDVLLIKRPAGQRTWSNTYQVGPHETMNWRKAGEKIESCFDLARRALSEELGIEDSNDYYNRIIFSWFGYYLTEGSGYFFAHVQTRLTKQQILEKIEGAESRWEIGDIDWIPLSSAAVSPIIDTWRKGPFEFEKDPNGRVWLPMSVLSLAQLHRVTRLGLMTR